MKTPPRISALLALLFVITALPSVWAGLCLKCSQLSYIANVGACKQCGEFTSSGAFALCTKCSAKENKCQHCQEPVAAPGKQPAPAPVVHKAPNGKPFPAHWGEPPRLQTKDLRLLPGGYGSGSGTLANWIQQNLDKDAAKEKPAPVAHKAPNGKAFPAHWGEPPRIQTRDLRPLPGGYGEGSGTLAAWIQQNLDKDAAKAKDTPDKPAPAPQAAVAAKVHSGHFVSNQYKPQDALTLAVFSTSAEFKAAFGTAAFGLGAGGKRLDYVGDAAFADGVVAALIRRDNTMYSYQLASTAKTDEGVLTLNILSAGKPDAAATFASPLIVSLPRAGVTHVRFVENDKVLGEVPLAAAVKEPAPATPAIVLDKTPGNKGGGKAKRKPFPAHWGAPPRIQTADYGPLPGGYGNGSSTMRGWIQKNLDLDAKDPNRGKAGKPEDKQAEIERIQKRIVAIKALMQVARFTKEGYDKIQAELAELTARLKQLQAEDPAAPVKPQAARPPVSDAFAQLHPAGSYAPGDLLIGMKEGLSKADGEKALATALPGLTVVKGMFNNTILHVQLPPALNVEQAMAKLKGLPEVSYSELNQIVSITPVPRVLPRPQLQRQ